MSLADVVAASSVFPFTVVDTSGYGGPGLLPLRVVMVAIAGAESGYNGDAAGDDVSTFLRLGRSAYSNAVVHSCNGKTSFGAWQINLPTWWRLVQRMSGESAPCAQAAWLANYDNSAAVAAAIAKPDGSGLTNWTTYASGKWVAYLGEAQQAVLAASGVPLQGIPLQTMTLQAVPRLSQPSSLGGLFGSGIGIEDIVILAIVAKLVLSGLATL